MLELENLLFLLDCQAYREAALSAEARALAVRGNTSTATPPEASATAAGGPSGGVGSAAPSAGERQTSTPTAASSAPGPGTAPWRMFGPRSLLRVAPAPSPLAAVGREGAPSSPPPPPTPSLLADAAPPDAASSSSRRQLRAAQEAQATALRRLRRLYRRYCAPGAELAVNVSAVHARAMQAAGQLEQRPDPAACVPAVREILRLLAAGAVLRFVASPAYPPFLAELKEGLVLLAQQSYVGV